jgi:hypothetical protein
MNPQSSSDSLLRETLRATAFMIVPVVAFLAILSAVALFAVPKPAVKDVDTAADHGPPSADQPAAPPHAAPNARASVKPNKI